MNAPITTVQELNEALDTLQSEAKKALESVRRLAARQAALQEAAEWIVMDSQYAAPEMCIEKSRIWIARLRRALAEQS